MAFPGKKHLFSSDFVQGLPWPMAVLKAAKNWKLFCADTCNWATFKMPSITTDGRFFLLLSHSSEGLTRTPNSWYFHRNIFHPVTLELLALCWHFAESKWSFTPLWMTNWRKLLLLIEEENTGMKRRRDKRRSLRGNWDAYMAGEKRWCTYYWCTNSKRIGSTSQKPVPSGYCSG